MEAREKLVWLNVVTNGEEEESMPVAYAVASSKFNLRKMNMKGRWSRKQAQFPPNVNSSTRNPGHMFSK